MKKMSYLFLATILFICGKTFGQTAQDTVYLAQDSHADAGKYLPAPPDTASLPFVDDFQQWIWGSRCATLSVGDRQVGSRCGARYACVPSLARHLASPSASRRHPPYGNLYDVQVIPAAVAQRRPNRSICDIVPLIG